MATKLKAIPRSEATTAWELLQDVKREILAEPKRLNMCVWLMRDADVQALPENRRPECGTVGCIAGWAIALRGTPSQMQRVRSTPGYMTNPAERIAARLLGLNQYESYMLFDGGMASTPGTRRHAKDAAARIDRFLSEHERQLKAKQL